MFKKKSIFNPQICLQSRALRYSTMSHCLIFKSGMRHCPAREWGGVLRRQNEFILPPPPHTKGVPSQLQTTVWGGWGRGLSILPFPYPNLTYTTGVPSQLQGTVWGGWWRGALPPPLPIPLTLPTQLQQNSCTQIHNKQYRIQNIETHVHKITNAPVFLYGAWTYCFWYGKIHYSGHCNGWVLKIKIFWGPKMATSKVSAIWAQKIPLALEMDCPASKSLPPVVLYCKHHITKECHNTCEFQNVTVSKHQPHIT
jgi:hypothetical protein